MKISHEVVKGVRFEEAYTGEDVTVLFLASEEECDDIIRIEGPRSMCAETAQQVADAITNLIEGCHEDGDYAEELQAARAKLATPFTSAGESKK